MTAAPLASRAQPLRVAVRAAGGLIVRRGADHAPRVVLVHRPRQDDWSFPKGRQKRGETLLGTALREVREETGFLCVAEAVVGTTEYVDRYARPKLVRYWVMRHVTGTFSESAEVDAMAWVRPREAVIRLTHERDRELLDSALAQIEGVLERRDDLLSASLG